MSATARERRARVEVCVDSIESVLEAQDADRLELCAALSEGGLTPSRGFLRKAAALSRAPLHVMIRPRGGDFVYTEDEIGIMREDIECAKEAGAAGVVFGVLTLEGDLDEERCRELLRVARPLECTFHRAIDVSRDPIQVLRAAARLGFTRILSSGCKRKAIDGASRLREMVQQAENRIQIMAGSGISHKNVAQIVSLTGVKDVHLSARIPRKSAAEVHSHEVSMGSNDCEEVRMIADSAEIRRVTEALAQPTETE